MASPSGETPAGALSGLGGIAAWGQKTEQQYKDEVYDQIDGAFGDVGIFGGLLRALQAAVTAFFAGFASVVDAIFGTVNNDYVAALPIINDHSQTLADLQDAFDQLILQGIATVFVDNDTYYPSEGIVSIDVIIIGAGAGGGGGRWDLVPANRAGGSGGGGGGEVHTTINASLLPKNPDGSFQGIPILIGAGGAGATSSEGPGRGGGNTSFGTFLTAGGGQGGLGGNAAVGAIGGVGGAGMIPGGSGGDGAMATGAVAGAPGGNSTSPYEIGRAHV